MEVKHQTDNGQAALWNGRSGRAWVDAQEVLDQMLKPFEDLLVEAVRAGPGHRVLDVGCGTGSTTLAVARRLGAKGHCMGVDVSEPMLAVARARAKREETTVSFLRADVQRHAFEPASFDTIISRFGVMFFDNPVQAFANLRRAARDGAELRCIVWRSTADNPFMTTAERAAAPLLPNMPARQPDAPGPFSLADRHRVASILEESGWAEIDVQPLDVDCTLPENELVGYLTRIGPVGLSLQEADERTRKKVIDTVRTAFEPYVHGAEVRYTAACWMVSARAPLMGLPR
ncbi:class I SAM-dependent methyltransferase [Melittangium boletus]|uniref:SAM-dependent methyltransferase n=1 Tax=Melittangium boletus DSM 14713 TaxID=1294270 RepID=A0A250IPK9_9BACT|nr:methyltransferase domain-containing protein [Melittangium boletus]ATB32876.1 SAM-dependent methyltransferase [Melittangium boletus DSM 14713]